MSWTSENLPGRKNWFKTAYACKLEQATLGLRVPTACMCSSKRIEPFLKCSPHPGRSTLIIPRLRPIIVFKLNCDLYSTPCRSVFATMHSRVGIRRPSFKLKELVRIMDPYTRLATLRKAVLTFQTINALLIGFFAWENLGQPPSPPASGSAYIPRPMKPEQASVSQQRRRL